MAKREPITFVDREGDAWTLSHRAPDRHGRPMVRAIRLRDCDVRDLRFSDRAVFYGGWRQRTFARYRIAVDRNVDVLPVWFVEGREVER